MKTVYKIKIKNARKALRKCTDRTERKRLRQVIKELSAIRKDKTPRS